MMDFKNANNDNRVGIKHVPPAADEAVTDAEYSASPV
jgi:hypothetical protein